MLSITFAILLMPFANGHASDSVTGKLEDDIASATLRYQLATTVARGDTPIAVSDFLRRYYGLTTLLETKNISIQDPQVEIAFKDTLNALDEVMACAEKTAELQLEALAFAIQEPGTTSDDEARLKLLMAFPDLLRQRALQPLKKERSFISLDTAEVVRSAINYSFWGFCLKAASYVIMAEYEHHAFLTEQVLHSVAAFTAGGAMYSVMTQSYWQTVEHLKSKLAKFKAQRTLSPTRKCESVFNHAK